MTDFLIIGSRAEVEKRLPGMVVSPMRHWTCGEPKQIRGGDTAWIVAVFDGRLTVIAPLTVDDIVPYEKARKRCNRPFEFIVPAEHMTDAYIAPLKNWLRDGATDENIQAAKNSGGMQLTEDGYDPYEKPHHMFAVDGTEEFPKFLDISAHAAKLRIDSPDDKDRLNVVDGRVNPQQLQAMRKLTDASAALLRKIWDDAGPGLRDISRLKPSKKAARAAPAPARKKSLLQKADSDELQRLNQQYAKADAKRKRRMVESVERGRAGEAMKKHRGHKCQVCAAMGMNPVGFKTKRGIPYAEAHHVEEVGKGGGLGPENIVVLCANHHRQMHSGNVALERKTAGEFVFRIDGKRVAVARYSP